MIKVLVTGAAGFIGSHLVDHLKETGDYFVRAVDWKVPSWDLPKHADEFDWGCDLREFPTVMRMMDGFQWVFALAADMGGMGFISRHPYSIMRNNMYVNLNTAEAARRLGVERILFTSSACVYPEDLQTTSVVPELRERDAWKGMPDTSYGREKLFAEDLYTQLEVEKGIKVSIARFHNIYGPRGTYNGGREKAPAAMCRKAAVAKLTGSNQIEVWGDGQQVRSFCYITDCLAMLSLLMKSNYPNPVNIGTDEAVTIDSLACMAAEHAGLRDVELVHVPGPEGVRSRNADLQRMRDILGYAPEVNLTEGMYLTYKWIEEQICKPMAEGQLS